MPCSSGLDLAVRKVLSRKRHHEIGSRVSWRSPGLAAFSRSAAARTGVARDHLAGLGGDCRAHLLGYFLVAFSAYWLWRSIEFTTGLLVGLARLHSAQRRDWLAVGRAGWTASTRLHHVVIVPTFTRKRRDPERNARLSGAPDAATRSASRSCWRSSSATHRPRPARLRLSRALRQPFRRVAGDDAPRPARRGQRQVVESGLGGALASRTSSSPAAASTHAICWSRCAMPTRGSTDNTWRRLDTRCCRIPTADCTSTNRPSCSMPTTLDCRCHCGRSAVCFRCTRWRDWRQAIGWCRSRPIR